MILLLIFILGLVFGSFLNVLILRYNTGESVIKESSKCFACGKKLKWRELIPVLSFIIQKGRCRNCGVKISLEYFIVEIIAGFIFIFVYLKQTDFFEYAFFYSKSFSVSALNLLFSKVLEFSLGFHEIFFIIFPLVFFSSLIIISVYDYHHKIIPAGYSYFLFFLSIAYVFLASYIFFDLKFLIRNVLSGAALFLFFFLFSYISHEKLMGYGDSKLAASIGLFLGPVKSLMALTFSFWLGAIFGIFIMMFLKKLSFKSQVPFAPFLSLGAFLAFLIELDFIYLLLV